MNRKTIARKVLKDKLICTLLVISPIAVAAQFIGQRSPLEVVLSVVTIVALTAYVLRSGYRRVADRHEDAVRSLDIRSRRSAMDRGEVDPGPSTLVDKLNQRYSA